MDGANRRLRERLAGSGEWEEFEARSKAWPIFGGLGNEDEYRTDHDGGFIGMSFRSSTRHAAVVDLLGRQPPAGCSTLPRRLLHGDTVFEGDDTFKGKPIRVCFTWSRSDDPSPRWEQAFSEDGGETWETNRVNDFTGSEVTDERRPGRLPSGEGDRTCRGSSWPGARLGGTTSPWPTSRCRGRSGRWRAAASAGPSTRAQSRSRTTSASCSCTAAGRAFLPVSTWRNDNELWETVWAKDGDAAGFHPWPLEGTHRPTFCVWELGAVWHEQQAWSRFLRSERDAEAQEAYLHDVYAGEVQSAV